ncbi:MAG: LacI family transcriptional regulator [Treponema sp.]|jgi:LacI family transcriptional regulator|nr:LacI family transcriptional regulator [Treponema sp.]
MITIKDIAAAAGVSVSTVSNVMNHKPNVGSQTKERILRLCQEMHYVPNAAGKSLKTGESKTILFNFSDFDRSFYLKIIEGIHDYAGDNGYDLMICTTKSCEKYMHNRLTDGCIILDGRMEDKTLQRAASAHYPIVVLDRVLPNPYIKSLVVNNYDPMTELVEGIVERGYRSFAFIGGIEHTQDNKERFQAFIDVLSKHHIPFHREHYFSGDYREQSGYQAAKIFMSAPELPEIFVCANDNMAIGAMKALHERGYRIPDDVALTGFDNCERASMVGLTTVTVPDYERGYLAAGSLIENIRGKHDCEPMKLTAVVAWRESVALHGSP